MFIDSHCHLDFACFDESRSRVIIDAQAAGVQYFVIPGVSLARWHKQISLANTSSYYFVALGIHPFFLHEYNSGDLEKLDDLLSSPLNVVALGECGIDCSLNESKLELQIRVFTQQVVLAKKYNKPLIIHHRKSIDLILKILRQQQFTYGGVFHAFSGSTQQAEAIIKLGFKLGVGGTITYERGQKTRAALAQVPLSSLVLETDSPDMPISGQQGKINQPSNIAIIFEYLVALRQESREEIKRACFENTRGLFNLPMDYNEQI